MTIPILMLFILLIFPAVCIFGAIFLTAWIIFRIKFAGTGYRMVQPGVRESTGPKSYVADLFRDLGETVDESPEAKRIRDQMLKQPEIKDVIKEVEGLA